MCFSLKFRLCLLAAVGGMILAFGLCNIHAIANITEGGVLGLTLLFEYHFSISPAVSGLFLNALCYFIGWRSLGTNFIGYSAFAGGSFSLFYAIFEKFSPIYPEIAECPLFACVIGAVFVGVGVGISVRAGGAPSGDDALAMSLSKLLRTNIKYIYLITDITVLSLSLSYIPLERILYSVLTVIISAQIIALICRRPDKNSFDEKLRVLVGTLRNPEQLTTAISKKFYHIPAIRLHSGIFPLDYIAIYQSRHKFGENSCILYYGEIDSYSLVKRSEITEIPKANDEMYYRFEIREWEKLPSPIRSDCEDFVNLETSLFLLKNARKISELSLASQKELLMYRNIEKLVSGELPKISHNRATIRISDGKLCITRKASPGFSVSLEDYKNKPLEMFRYIAREISL